MYIKWCWCCCCCWGGGGGGGGGGKKSCEEANNILEDGKIFEGNDREVQNILWEVVT